MSRRVLIGAHLRPEDVAAEGVVAIDLGELTLSALPLQADQSPSSPQVIQRGLRVRDELLATAVFIAFRWGSVIRSSDEAREHCAGRIERWRTILESSRDLVEMTLKTTGRGRPARPDRKVAAGGGDYLRRLHQASHAVEIDEELLAFAEASFGSIAVRSQRLHRPDGGVELAMLVPRERLDEIREAAGRLRDALPDRPFLFSGPWPLETFVE